MPLDEFLQRLSVIANRVVGGNPHRTQIGQKAQGQRIQWRGLRHTARLGSILEFRNAKKVVNIAFYRTGSTSRPLEVADTVGGTATPGIDDTGLATALAVRTI
jgi:hypothetical protein